MRLKKKVEDLEFRLKAEMKISDNNFKELNDKIFYLTDLFWEFVRNSGYEPAPIPPYKFIKINKGDK